jgi:hypothetical protein
LKLVNVPAASIEINALPDFFLCERDIRNSQTHQQQRKPKHALKLTNSGHSICPAMGHWWQNEGRIPQINRSFFILPSPCRPLRHDLPLTGRISCS